MTEGCITRHTLAIHDRGGGRRVAALRDVASVSWGRSRDDFTRARAVIAGQACLDQLNTLSSIEARRHELVIHRGDVRVWEGPIRDVRWFTNRVEIIADDVGAYLGTMCSVAWPGPDGGGNIYMTERIREIIEYELTESYVMDVGLTVPELVNVPRWEGLDPPANVLPHLDVRASTGTGAILTTASVEAFQMTVAEHLRNLARGGLDFTVVGRSIVIWDSLTALDRTRPVSETDFIGEMEVIASGADHASIAHAVAPGAAGANGEELPPAVGNAGAPDDYYGVWTRLVTREDEDGADTPGQLELNSQARRDLSGRNPVPTQINAPGGIVLGVGLTIDDLVPGVILPVRATMNLRPVSQNQILDSLTVSETAAGEDIGVELIPAGPLEEA